MPYADWLIAVFDHTCPKPATASECLRHHSLDLALECSAEAVGQAPSWIVVIETHGAIEQVDTLKVACATISWTRFGFLRSSFARGDPVSTSSSAAFVVSSSEPPDLY
jgi:uncharacterized protein